MRARPHRDRAARSSELLGFKRGALDGPARNWLGIIHPSRARPLPRHARRRGRSAARAHQPGFPHARRGRALPLVRPAGPADRRLRRRGACAARARSPTSPTRSSAEERLLHDAVHDNLTGLPNRQLFLDRLEIALNRSRAERRGAAVGRHARHRQLQAGERRVRHSRRRLRCCSPSPAACPALLKPQDTLARLARRPVRLHAHLGEPARAHRADDAETCATRSSAPIPVGERDIFLTASVGIAMHDGKQVEAEEQMQGRRERHVSGQALRRRLHPVLPPGAPPAGTDLATSRPNSARRSAARRSRSSTSRSCAWRTSRSPASRRWPAGSIRCTAASRRRNSSRGRGERADRPARPLRARPHGARARRLAGGARPLDAALRQRQRVEPPAAPPRPHQRREGGAGAHRRQPRDAEARGHRDRW